MSGCAAVMSAASEHPVRNWLMPFSFWGARVDLVPIQGLKVVPVDVSDTSSNKILLDLISANSWM